MRNKQSHANAHRCTNTRTCAHWADTWNRTHARIQVRVMGLRLTTLTCVPDVRPLPGQRTRHTSTLGNEGNVKIAFFLQYRNIVASTCRRFVQFVCYVTWVRMAKCASVMIKIRVFIFCGITVLQTSIGPIPRHASTGIILELSLVVWIHTLCGRCQPSVTLRI